MFDHIFPSPQLEWKTSEQNYPLDLVGFRRQEDSHSCSVYVIAGFTKFGANTDHLPTLTFYNGHESELTDLYRSKSMKRYVMNIILASEMKCSGNVSEGDVAVFQYESCKDRLMRRRKK